MKLFRIIILVITFNFSTLSFAAPINGYKIFGGCLTSVGSLVTGYYIDPVFGAFVFVGGGMILFSDCSSRQQESSDDEHNVEDGHEEYPDIALKMEEEEKVPSAPQIAFSEYLDRKDLSTEKKQELLEYYICANQLIEYSLYNAQTGSDALLTRNKLIDFLLKHFPECTFRQLRDLACNLANYKEEYWPEKAELDLFTDKDLEEKQEMLQQKIKESPFFQKLIERKKMDLDDVSNRISVFVFQLFPEISYSDAVKKATKLYTSDNMIEEEWQKILQ
jgi:hypothetical protein